MSGPILLYDGTCAFCNGTVQFILQHERRRSLRFAPLEGEVGLAIRRRHPQLEGVDAVVWVTPARGDQRETVAVRSDAALDVARYLGGPWLLALVARLLPRRLRDRAYDLIARHRHRLPGLTVRFTPPSEMRDRFLG